MGGPRYFPCINALGFGVRARGFQRDYTFLLILGAGFISLTILLPVCTLVTTALIPGP